MEQFYVSAVGRATCYLPVQSNTLGIQIMEKTALES